jgi:hypothetical protein
MDITITSHLAGIRLGKLHQYKGIGVIPLFLEKDGPIDYLILSEALAQRLLEVTEVSEGGSVPQLKVVSRSDRAILLLDGEELAGAKQNRVLNTTILVPPKATLTIPVSCTEHGRWSYSSPVFRDSDTMMPRTIKARKAATVTDSLRRDRSYHSDQGLVWDSIAELSDKACVNSPTGAMKDVRDSWAMDLAAFQKEFPAEPGQHGLLVFLNGEVAGLDLLSRQEGYRAVHPKLVMSYAMDALADPSSRKRKPSLEKATAFLEKVRACADERFESVGLGWDHRVMGDGIAGNALVHVDTVIHLGVFSMDESHDDPRLGPYARYHLRRDFRRGRESVIY